MNQSECQEVKELIKTIIDKMCAAIGRDFSQLGRSSLLDEVSSLQKKVDEILNKNVKADR